MVLLILALVFVIYSIENMKRTRYSAALIMTTVGATCFLLSMASMAVVIFLNYINELAYTAALLWVAGTVLISMGQAWKINSFKKIYGSLRNVLSLSSSKWSLIGTVVLLLGIPIYLLFFFQTVTEGFNWYSVGSETIWIVVFVCLVIAERKLFLVSSTPSLKILEAKMVQNDIQTLVAYSNLTNRFLAHIIPVIGASGVEDTISQCIEEHPILFGDKIIESGLLNVDQLIKNSKRIHESERTQELFNAFSDLNTTIIDLYAVLTSPNQANYLVATEAELYRDDIALWKAGVPLGKYNEAVYERDLVIGLPEGVADADKASNFAYILFKRYLELLLSKCKKSSKIEMKKKLSELASKNPVLGRIILSDEGKFDLSKLYRYLSKAKFKEGMQEIVRAFSIAANICYDAAKSDLGIKKASEIGSEIFSELLRRYGGFLQHYGIIEAIPKGVQISGTYLPLIAGKCYLVEGKSSKHAFRMFFDLVRFGNPGLIITTSHPAHARREHNIPERITILWLSKVEVEDAISPSNLGIIRDRISAFVSKKENAVVMLEGLEYLITTNGFDLTLKMMHDIREITVVNRARLIVPVSPLALEPKQLEMMRRFMEVIQVEEEI
ncbi:MAG: DUF835 domain-containing protein [Candidatus Hadarchaeum sp.]|uniref:DUF835 domain-containing protein n=2 Tax=Candidatus Hadarchaeum sp. TaxID=2883567 RepID=UPI00317B4FA4